MARPNAVFVCGSCGGETLKWQGQCPPVRRVEHARAARRRGRACAPRRAAAAITLALSTPRRGPGNERLGTGHGELDRVLGGGLVAGSVTLLGGDPGIGKSTLLLQVAAHVAAGHPVLYASGEESVAQVAARARRLALGAKSLALVARDRSRGDPGARRASAAPRCW